MVGKQGGELGKQCCCPILVEGGGGILTRQGSQDKKRTWKNYRFCSRRGIKKKGKGLKIEHDPSPPSPGSGEAALSEMAYVAETKKGNAQGSSHLQGGRKIPGVHFGLHSC